jgi:hypothetical protein
MILHCREAPPSTVRTGCLPAPACGRQRRQGRGASLKGCFDNRMGYLIRIETKNVPIHKEIMTYLETNYWSLILGTFVARRGNIFAGTPGVNLKAIYQSVVRIHIFILLSAFLFFLIYFGIEVYQRDLLLILLFFFFFFFPIRIFGRNPQAENYA